MTGREWCRQTLQWLADESILPAFDESGRFASPPESRFSLARDQRLLSHYAQLSGPLYRDEYSWGKAAAVVESFLSSPNRPRQPWRQGEPVQCPEGLGPVEILRDVESAIVRLGFEVRDRNARAQQTVFSLQDRCTIEDLPEPYGKWHQHRKNRARWEEAVTIEVEVKAGVQLSSTGGQMRGALQLDWTALIPSAADAALRDLAKMPGWRHIDSFAARRQRRTDLKSAAAKWLDQAQAG